MEVVRDPELTEKFPNEARMEMAKRFLHLTEEDGRTLAKLGRKKFFESFAIVLGPSTAAGSETVTLINNAVIRYYLRQESGDNRLEALKMLNETLKLTDISTVPSVIHP